VNGVPCCARLALNRHDDECDGKLSISLLEPECRMLSFERR